MARNGLQQLFPVFSHCIFVRMNLDLSSNCPLNNLKVIVLMKLSSKGKKSVNFFSSGFKAPSFQIYVYPANFVYLIASI